jgi:hypothetical protein
LRRTKVEEKTTTIIIGATATIHETIRWKLEEQLLSI